MKTLLLIFLFLGFTTDQTDFYRIFSNDSKEEITNKIISLEKIKERTVIQNGYLAALVMKKSSYEKDVKVKIKTFKSGALSLERLIDSNQKNLELRFIRLIIQENSPKILKYNTNIEDDVNFILSNLNSSTEELKLEIRNYALVSENLNL